MEVREVCAIQKSANKLVLNQLASSGHIPMYLWRPKEQDKSTQYKMEADTAVTFIYLLYFSICLKSHELFQCRCIGTVITYFVTDFHNRQFLSISLLSERTDIFFIYTKKTCLTQKMSIYLSTVQLYRKVSTNSTAYFLHLLLPLSSVSQNVAVQQSLVKKMEIFAPVFKQSF